MMVALVPSACKRSIPLPFKYNQRIRGRNRENKINYLFDSVERLRASLTPVCIALDRHCSLAPSCSSRSQGSPMICRTRYY
ncbi:unnamed protein product [Haemonchus placei]|uniref:BHLH domain-containing protein n=1 Tax=Haemonchus placei TaxID=6290 RepID=A0A0N4X9R1_HAEPC|nr:unnamed protein product [Haemonchus placei]